MISDSAFKAYYRKNIMESINLIKFSQIFNLLKKLLRRVVTWQRFNSPIYILIISDLREAEGKVFPTAVILIKNALFRHRKLLI